MALPIKGLNIISYNTKFIDNTHFTETQLPPLGSGLKDSMTERPPRFHHPRFGCKLVSKVYGTRGKKRHRVFGGHCRTHEIDVCRCGWEWGWHDGINVISINAASGRPTFPFTESKGHTWEERYGKVRAAKMKAGVRRSLKKYYQENSHHIKGMKFEERYGEERAWEIREKMSRSREGYKPTEEHKRNIGKASAIHMIGNRNAEGKSWFIKGHKLLNNKRDSKGRFVKVDN